MTLLTYGVPNLALFDFDGTITSTDTFTPFVSAAVKAHGAWWDRLLLLPLLGAYKWVPMRRRRCARAPRAWPLGGGRRPR